LNEKTRFAYLLGFEIDNDTQEVFLEGFNTPVPQKLVDIFKEYHENKYPMTALKNFWSLLMSNPDKRVRTSLFDFIAVHDFSITTNGYFIAYKYVANNEKKKVTKKQVAISTQLKDFVTKQVLHVTKDWKTAPKKYVVYKDLKTDVLFLTKETTAATWDEKARDIQIMGNLEKLNKSLITEPIAIPVLAPDVTDEIVFTDRYSYKMHIQLGVPVLQKRGECDSDPGNECSKGLHVGSTRYVQSNASEGDTILVCLVNPANVVSVPSYDKSKIRVCEYFPFAVAKFTNKKIDIIEQKYYESDYKNFEVTELNESIAKIKAEELPYEAAINAEPETRPMSELLKQLETRLVILK